MKKKLIIFKVLCVIVALMSMNMKCPTPHECSMPDISTYYSSVNVFDQIIGIYTQTFNFTQTQKSYTDAECGSLTSSTDLKITNTTAFTASYDYTITFHLNLVSWEKQGTVTIPPQGTIDVGEVNESAARIDLGQIVVTYYNVSYK
jgi:hypothetical protein